METFTVEKIQKKKISYLECLNNLNKCSLMRMATIEFALVSYLGTYLWVFCEWKEVGLLSKAMMIRLIKERRKYPSVTIFRFKTFITWLSANSLETEEKETILEMIDFSHFSVKDLASDVKNSSLYSDDKIIKRMEKLFKEKENALMLKDFEVSRLEVSMKEADKELEETRTEIDDLFKKANYGILEEKETEIEKMKQELETKKRQMSGKRKKIKTLKEDLFFFEEAVK